MDLHEAMECPDTLGVTNPRRRLLRTADGRLFLGKNTLCPKRPGEQNPTWLANEMIFAEFARAATLRIPDLRLLENRGYTFLGSEVLSDRKCLGSAAVLTDLFTETNRVQLVRTLLLDLALLNNDRTHKNVLSDRDGLLWFVDHDKSLWGDGLSPTEHPPGDLGRLKTETLDRKFEDYVGDYLAFAEANALAFNPQNWAIAVKEFQMLPLDLDVLVQAQKMLPSSWLNDDQFRRMKSFLLPWWKRLRNFIENENAVNQLLTILESRGRLTTASSRRGTSHG